MLEDESEATARSRSGAASTIRISATARRPAIPPGSERGQLFVGSPVRAQAPAQHASCGRLGAPPSPMWTRRSSPTPSRRSSSTCSLVTAGAGVAACFSLRTRGPVVSNVNPKTSPIPNAIAGHHDVRSSTTPPIPMSSDQLPTCRRTSSRRARRPPAPSRPESASGRKPSRKTLPETRGQPHFVQPPSSWESAIVKPAAATRPRAAQYSPVAVRVRQDLRRRATGESLRPRRRSG